jgi:hypothetical protein
VSPRLKSDRLRLVSPPSGFWRVTDWPDPFSPRDAPPPVGGVEPEFDDAGRFDAPTGEYRTLYCATKPEGALGEKIAAFAFDARVAQRIEGFFESESDLGAGRRS